jgi:DNA-binding GntR family transcriptional regulator
MVFDAIEQQTTEISVLRVVRRAILSGGLPPGSPLREAHIAADLGVSRAPLRQALRTLEEEGLVVKVPFTGTYVADVGPERVREIESLRERLEPWAVRLALPALRDGGRERLAQLADELTHAAQAGDIPASIDAHLGVHRLFYELAGHQLLLNMWLGWEGQLRLFLARDHQSFDNLPAIDHDHRRLLELFDAGDDDTLEAEVIRHVQGSLLVGTPAAHARPDDTACR